MENLLVAVLLTLCVCSGIFLRYIPFRAAISQKQRKHLVGIYIAAGVFNIALVTAGMYIRGINFAFNYLRFGGIIFAAIMTAVNILVLGRWFREQMFVFGIVLTCHYLLMTLPNLIITLIHNATPHQLLLVILGLYFLVLMLTAWPLSILLKKTMAPFLRVDAREYWSRLWFLPIIYFIAKFVNLGGEHNVGGLGQVVSSLLTGFIMVTLCFAVSGDHARMLERQRMEEQLAAQQNHYTELKDKVEYTRKLNHNLKHHVAAIRGYADAGNMAGLNDYCNDLMARIGQMNQIPYTGNVAADGVVYHYKQLAQQNDIHFQLAGTLHSHGIADIDLCALLGNALDNAVTGCLTVKEGRSISVISQSEDRLLSVVVRNTFDGRIRQDKDGIFSSKRIDSYGHGLPSMESICKRYDGSMDVQWDDGSFTVMFLLPLKEK